MSENKVVILDGYPRTINQAQFLDSITGFNYKSYFFICRWRSCL